MSELDLRDRDGDRLTVRPESCDPDATILYLNTYHPDGVGLDRAQVAELRDYLTEWLGDQQDDALRDPGTLSRACAMLSAAETVKATGGAVEIAGVRIEPCYEYGQTTTTSELADARERAAQYAADANLAESQAHDCVLMDCDPGEACVIGCTAVGDHRATGCVVRTALEDAQAAVYGPREEDYGHPRRNFTRTAILWHGVLMDKLADGESITPQDVALCMVQVKVAREVHEPKRDNRVDGAGYFLTLDRLETGR